MKKYLMAAVLITVMLVASCGGGEEQDSGMDTDGGAPVDDAGSSGEIAAEPGESYNTGDEMVCRANMESIAMMLLNEKGMSGSLPGNLEEFHELNPAYAQMDITCGGTAYEYEVEGGDFTLTCPNGHGDVHNDQTSWTW